MRTLTSFFALAVLSVNMPAQQSFIITPSSLAGWTVTGADAATLNGSDELALPAGAQLAHSFLATDVAIKLSTSPVIGGAAADWPALELGNCALVFARNETGGKLIFVAGDNQPIDLPYSYSLDEVGRSAEPLVIEFSRKGASASVAVAGQTLQFPVGPLSGQALEVIASAGTTDAWNFAFLEVLVGAPPANQASAATSSAGFSGKNGRLEASERTTGAGTSSVFSPQARDAKRSDASSKAATDGNAKADSAGVSLEIFTPPAVRHGRVDAVRSALSTQKSN